eukprot:scaffold451_cov341-Pavlova_lutheri.AAC.3
MDLVPDPSAGGRASLARFALARGLPGSVANGAAPTGDPANGEPPTGASAWSELPDPASANGDLG